MGIKQLKNLIGLQREHTDSDLCNHVIAYGPGDGINRPLYHAVNQDSVDVFCKRECVVEFDAVDDSQLELLAEEYLDNSANPQESYVVTHNLPEGECLPLCEIGDTIQFVDPKLKIIRTERIEEIRSPSEGCFEYYLNNENDLRTLANAINQGGDNGHSLGLPPPVGLQCTPDNISGGAIIQINPYVNSSASGVEIHYSTVGCNFTMSQTTLLDRGTQTYYEFDTGTLAPGVKYHIKTRAYGGNNNDDYSDESSCCCVTSAYASPTSLDPDFTGSIVYLNSVKAAINASVETVKIGSDCIDFSDVKTRINSSPDTAKIDSECLDFSDIKQQINSSSDTTLIDLACIDLNTIKSIINSSTETTLIDLACLNLLKPNSITYTAACGVAEFSDVIPAGTLAGDVMPFCFDETINAACPAGVKTFANISLIKANTAGGVIVGTDILMNGWATATENGSIAPTATESLEACFDVRVFSDVLIDTPVEFCISYNIQVVG